MAYIRKKKAQKRLFLPTKLFLSELFFEYLL